MVGHCRDTLPVGHCRDTLRLGIARIFSDWGLQGYFAVRILCGKDTLQLGILIDWALRG